MQKILPDILKFNHVSALLSSDPDLGVYISFELGLKAQQRDRYGATGSATIRDQTFLKLVQEFLTNHDITPVIIMGQFNVRFGTDPEANKDVQFPAAVEVPPEYTDALLELASGTGTASPTLAA